LAFAATVTRDDEQDAPISLADSDVISVRDSELMGATLSMTGDDSELASTMKWGVEEEAPISLADSDVISVRDSELMGATLNMPGRTTTRAANQQHHKVGRAVRAPERLSPRAVARVGGAARELSAAAERGELAQVVRLARVIAACAAGARKAAG